MKPILFLMFSMFVCSMCVAQKSMYSDCYFLESTFRNEQFTRLLKLDTTSARLTAIVDKQGRFEKCNLKRFANKHNAFVVYDHTPKAAQPYYECNNVSRRNGICVVVIVEPTHHLIFKIFYKSKGDEWEVDHIDSGIM